MRARTRSTAARSKTPASFFPRASPSIQRGRCLAGAKASHEYMRTFAPARQFLTTWSGVVGVPTTPPHVVKNLRSGGRAGRHPIHAHSGPLISRLDNPFRLPPTPLAGPSTAPPAELIPDGMPGLRAWRKSSGRLAEVSTPPLTGRPPAQPAGPRPSNRTGDPSPRPPPPANRPEIAAYRGRDRRKSSGAGDLHDLTAAAEECGVPHAARKMPGLQPGDGGLSAATSEAERTATERERRPRCVCVCVRSV